MAKAKTHLELAEVLHKGSGLFPNSKLIRDALKSWIAFFQNKDVCDAINRINKAWPQVGDLKTVRDKWEGQLLPLVAELLAQPGSAECAPWRRGIREPDLGIGPLEIEDHRSA